MLQADTTQHLRQARDYMYSISNEGLDVSALYITQAYLTKLQASLKPLNALSALFQQEDISALVDICCSPPACTDKSSQYNQRIISEPLLKYFKDTTSQLNLHCDHSPIEISHLINRIIDSLEEWEIITARANKLIANLDTYREHCKQYAELRKLEESLDDFLERILKNQQKLEFTTLESQNQSCSIQRIDDYKQTNTQSSQTLAAQLSKDKIVEFLQYLSMWMCQTLQEISQFKNVLDMAKSDSSIDIDQEYKLPKVVPQNRKVKLSKRSLLTSKIKQGHLDVPSIEANFFDENQKQKIIHTSGPNSAVGFPKSQMSFMTHKKPQKSHITHRKTLGEISLNKQSKQRRSRENCTTCEIY